MKLICGRDSDSAPEFSLPDGAERNQLSLMQNCARKRRESVFRPDRLQIGGEIDRLRDSLRFGSIPDQRNAKSHSGYPEKRAPRDFSFTPPASIGSRHQSALLSA